MERRNTDRGQSASIPSSTTCFPRLSEWTISWDLGRISKPERTTTVPDLSPPSAAILGGTAIVLTLPSDAFRSASSNASRNFASCRAVRQGASYFDIGFSVLRRRWWSAGRRRAGGPSGVERLANHLYARVQDHRIPERGPCVLVWATTGRRTRSFLLRQISPVGAPSLPASATATGPGLQLGPQLTDPTFIRPNGHGGRPAGVRSGRESERRGTVQC